MIWMEGERRHTPPSTGERMTELESKITAERLREIQ